MNGKQTFSDDLRTRLHADAAGLEPRLAARAAGALHARRRGTRRRRAARAALAACTAVLVATAGLTARELSRDPHPIDQQPAGPTTTPSTAAVEVVGTTSSTTVAPPTTAPPVTVLPDPAGAGAMPLEWREVTPDVAALGIVATDAAGMTYSLFDAAAAETSSTDRGIRPSMALASTTDGEVWERLGDVPWASDLAAAPHELLLAGHPTDIDTTVMRVRLAASSDGGATWDEQDVEVAAGIDTPVLNPIPDGMLRPFPNPILGPGASTSAPPPAEASYGTWSVAADSASPPELVAGPAGILAAVTVREPADPDSAPRCEGTRDASSVYWYTYRDGITIELRPSAGGYPTTFSGSVVEPGTDPPEGLVRCTVDAEALARPDGTPPAPPLAATVRTVVLRRDGERWRRLDSNLPNGMVWHLMAVGDRFVAESVGDWGIPRQLVSSDGERWEDVDPPRNWPQHVQDSSDVDAAHVIGTDRELGHVATSMDGGTTWIRVDLHQLAIPGGPAQPTTIAMSEARASAHGFAIRYHAAQGDRFWRVLATSRDGRTWATLDESPLFWTGMFGPRLAFAGDRVLMTTNDSAPVSFPSDGSPLVIGYTTRNHVGRPLD